MGEAKQKQTGLDAIDMARVAGAVRRLMQAAGPNAGSDCWTWAAYGQWLLGQLGVRAEIAVGWAAWRVGEGDGDVIANEPSSVLAGGGCFTNTGLVYHAWLEVAGRILDLTTCTLRLKAAQLDALDGRSTTVTWCPDFLFAEKREVSSIKRVAAEHAGLFYYERVSWLEEMVKEGATPLDDDDTGPLWLIYQNPQMRVFGPHLPPSAFA